MADEPLPAPAKDGRPRKPPTAEQQALICQCIREGNYREVAAQWAGVHLRTFYRWCAAGRKATDERDVHRQLWQAVLEAERAAEMAMVEAVFTAAKDDARHAQWYLERKFPERWAANRIELRELKKRVEEIEKNAAPPSPVDEKKRAPDPEDGTDKPVIVPRPGS